MRRLIAAIVVIGISALPAAAQMNDPQSACTDDQIEELQTLINDTEIETWIDDAANARTNAQLVDLMVSTHEMVNIWEFAFHSAPDCRLATQLQLEGFHALMNQQMEIAYRAMGLDDLANDYSLFATVNRFGLSAYLMFIEQTLN